MPSLLVHMAMQEQRIRQQLLMYQARIIPEPIPTKPTQTEQGWWHGSVYGYDKKACRCVFCKQGKAEYWRAYRARRRAAAGAHAHSLYGYRHHGCRCVVCKEAHGAAKDTLHRQRLVLKQAMAEARVSTRQAYARRAPALPMVEAEVTHE